VIARTQKMFKFLKEQFQARKVEKEYSVLVHGIIEKDHDTIDFEIDRGTGGVMVSRPKVDKTSLRQVKDIQPGKESLTEFLVQKRFGRFTLLSVLIHTGRTHQIRVHMRGYNHPVVGDEIYMNKKLNLKRDKELGRLFLHAARLCFFDLSDKKVCFTAPLPEQLQKFLTTLN
jgi:23S rRNA-/tRNA-specific pseudouridylate synthase